MKIKARHSGAQPCDGGHDKTSFHGSFHGLPVRMELCDRAEGKKLAKRPFVGYVTGKHHLKALAFEGKHKATNN